MFKHSHPSTYETVYAPENLLKRDTAQFNCNTTYFFWGHLLANNWFPLLLCKLLGLLALSSFVLSDQGWWVHTLCRVGLQGSSSRTLLICPRFN